MRDIDGEIGMSPAQLAKFWGCSRKTILRIIKRGELVAVNIGSPQNIRITKVDAAAYYQKNSRNLSSVGLGLSKQKIAGRPWGS